MEENNEMVAIECFDKVEVQRERNRSRRRLYSRGRSVSAAGDFRIGIVYASFNRPIENAGTILDDFIWRRSEAGKAPVKPAVIKNLIEGYISSYGVNVTKVVYSRKAGCTCGCSPGYIVYGTYDEDRSRLSPKFDFLHIYDEFLIYVAPASKIYADRYKQMYGTKIFEGAGI